MKRNIYMIIIIQCVVIMLMLSGCPTNNESNNSPPKHSMEMEAYKAVLKNNITFYDREEKENLLVSDIIKINESLNNDDDNYYFNIIMHFAILNVDGDEKPIVVLSFGEYKDYSLVLHYNDEIVYGDFNYIRQFNAGTLKTNGTYLETIDVGSYSYDKLQFTDGKLSSINISYHEEDDKQNVSESFSIGDVKVSESEFEDYIDTLEDVTWYELNQTNLETQFNSVN